MSPANQNGNAKSKVEKPKTDATDKTQSPPDTQNQLVLGIQISLAVYLLLMLLGSAYLVYDIATQNYSILKLLFKVEAVDPTDPLLLIMLAMGGGVLGGVVWGIDKLIKYSKNKKFDPVHTGDYLLRPFVAATLGAVVFVLVASGLFKMDLQGTQSNEQNATAPSATPEPVATEAFEELNGAVSPEPTPEPTTTGMEIDDAPTDQNATEVESSPFDKADGYYVFGIGFLAGFGSYQVTKKLDQVIKVIFGQLTKDDLDKD